jgi:outer membrane lipoprotein-sorting protein
MNQPVLRARGARLPALGFVAACLALFLTATSAFAIPPRSGEAGDQPRAPVQSGPEVKRVDAYLNNIHSLMARFEQVAPDGTISTGDFFLSRPGRLRFQYDTTPLLVVADGEWVIVYDKKLHTYDRYSIKQTPIDVLLDPTINLTRDLWVTDVKSSGGVLRVTARHPRAPQRGEITLIFSEEPFQLRQWVVIDAQGLTTEVTLSDIHPNVKLNPAMFVVPQPANNSETNIRTE